MYVIACIEEDRGFINLITIDEQFYRLRDKIVAYFADLLNGVENEN